MANSVSIEPPARTSNRKHTEIEKVENQSQPHPAPHPPATFPRPPHRAALSQSHIDEMWKRQKPQRSTYDFHFFCVCVPFRWYMLHELSHRNAQRNDVRARTIINTHTRAPLLHVNREYARPRRARIVPAQQHTDSSTRAPDVRPASAVKCA